MLKKFFAMVFIFSLLFVGVAGAVEAEQKSVILNAVPGREYSITLYVTGIGSDNLTDSGEASSWVTLRDIPSCPPCEGFLNVTISVPDDASIGCHHASINSNGETISRISIIVTQSFSGVADMVNEIESDMDNLDDMLDDMDTEQQTSSKKIEDIEKILDVMEDDIASLSDMVSKVYEKQSQINSFEAEKQLLRTRITELEGMASVLENKNTELSSITGNLTMSWSSIAFSAGFLIGILVIFLTKGMVSLNLKGLGKLRPGKIKLSRPKLGKKEKKNYSYSFK